MSRKPIKPNKNERAFKLGLSEIGATIRINLRFFGTGVFSILAVNIWPDDLDRWRMGVMSFALGLLALACTAESVKELARLLMQRSALRKQTKDATPIKHAREVDQDVLRDAGMTR